MEILIKNMQELLDDKLSLIERGLLISILLLKDPDPKITLAKVRAKVKLSQFKTELITLHEAGYVKWKGYRAAKKSLEKSKFNPQIKEVIEFMNNLYDRKFDYKSENTTKALRNRLEEIDVETIKEVVANRYAVWKDSEVMKKHLHPTTIFRPSKFEKYLEEVSRTREGISFVNAEKITIKAGEQLTSKNIIQLMDEDVYSVRVYDIYQGDRMNPRPQKLYGAHLKNLVKSQQKRLDRGDKEEYHYIYQQQKL